MLVSLAVHKIVYCPLQLFAYLDLLSHFFLTNMDTKWNY